MVFDDGTVIRLADDRFLRDHDDRQRRRRPRLDGGVAADRVAGAARALHVGHRAVGHRRRSSGPRSRDGRSPRSRPTSTSRNEAFPFMTWRDATVAGIAGPGLPDQLLGRAGLRDQRHRRGTACGLGGAVGGRCAVRHHAVRHRDDARPAGREGLPDHRPGDRRHGHPAGPRAWSWVGVEEEARLHRQAVVRPRRRTSRPDRKQLVGLLPVDPDVLLPEGAQVIESPTVLPRAAGADARPRHLELSQRRARPDVRAGAGRARAGSGSVETLYVPIGDEVVPVTVTDSVLFDKEGSRRDG